MTTEIPSIPLAPATSCCSTPPAPEGGLPIVRESSSGEACCQSAATVPQDGAAAGEEVPPPDDAALIDALRQVVDPELMINIVDLGLVYSINQTERKVVVEMTLTSPACPAGPQIISQAKMMVEKLPGVQTAEIKLTMSPPWTPDRMTDEARDQLGIF